MLLPGCEVRISFNVRSLRLVGKDIICFKARLSFDELHSLDWLTILLMIWWFVRFFYIFCFHLTSEKYFLCVFSIEAWPNPSTPMSQITTLSHTCRLHIWTQVWYRWLWQLFVENVNLHFLSFHYLISTKCCLATTTRYGCHFIESHRHNAVVLV